MFEKGDQIRLQIAGGVSILTVADTYKVAPEDQTFAIIEKLF
ncbi:hypothetical protein [Elizabethkingia sp. JS20170427COW]|nr:hypothetical protein [Elizabethkingia sp. JS20170427COW]